MQDFIYRVGTTDDIEKIVKLGISSFGQFKDQLSDINWKKLEAYLLNENTYPDLLDKSNGFVGTYEDEIIGMAFRNLMPAVDIRGLKMKVFKNNSSLQINNRIKSFFLEIHRLYFRLLY